MDEYINREAVVRYLKGYSEKELNSSSFGMITSSVLNKAERAISEMPAADVQPVNHWISVKDRMPPEDEAVLAWNKEGFPMIDVWSGKMWGCAWTVDEISHWMTLPEPPERKDDAE